MTSYIRPRQDFSLATMARAMRCLVCHDFHPMLHVYKGVSFPVILISIEAIGDKKDLCEKAIATLIDMEHFVKNNFKIIELSHDEIFEEVD